MVTSGDENAGEDDPDDGGDESREPSGAALSTVLGLRGISPRRGARSRRAHTWLRLLIVRIGGLIGGRGRLADIAQEHREFLRGISLPAKRISAQKQHKRREWREYNEEDDNREDEQR
jgi:hypothetical protein